MRSHGCSIPTILGLLLLCACHRDPHDSHAVRMTGPAIIQMPLPAELSHAERPLVEFDHQKHVAGLAQEGCAACHPSRADGQLSFRLKLSAHFSDDDEWMEAYHDLCIGCHDNRRRAGKPTGPDDCGDCHLKRSGQWQDADREMRFDYSLHYRHQRAYQSKCDACHHLYDEKQQKLLYRKGAEDACSACHPRAPQPGATALGDAVHTACVNCHIGRQGQGKATGPQHCAGCHGVEERVKIEKVKNVPRLDRGQPPAIWIASQGVSERAVPFNHRLHEGLVRSCSACHHQSIGECAECHTQLPGSGQDGVTLNQAFHQAGSELSCVGCHQQRSGEGACAGCHHMLPLPPGQAACELCHSGPVAEQVDPNGSPLAALAPVELAALPAFSESFPQALQLHVLADKYRPAPFPHGQIAAALDRAVRSSRLARRFHAKTETLCSGCHHRSSTGDPTPTCRSCHGDENAADRDLPELKAAYHRQCIGCHQAIGHPAQGCTDCHQEANK